MPPFLDLAPRDAGPLQQEPAIEFHSGTDSHYIPECPYTALCVLSTSRCGITSN